MLEKAILESTIFCNFSKIYHQLNSVNNTVQQQQQSIEATTTSQTTLSKDIMDATFKFKAIFYSIFLAQNPLLIQKSVRQIATYPNTDNSNDYRLKREKNNESVRKSRAKNRDKLVECSSSVTHLKVENVQLNKKLDNLQNELYTLKGLFQHCFSFNLNKLPFKPSDIPTSTLNKIIMQNKALETPSVGETSMTATTSKINDVDSYFINQIKGVLSTMNNSKPNVSLNPPVEK